MQTHKLNTLLLLFLVLLPFSTFAQKDFVTVWDLSKVGSGKNQLEFGVETSGMVTYTWEEISPGKAKGEGNFNDSICKIENLPKKSIVQINIQSNNFERININNGVDIKRLVDVILWGDVKWTSMANAFRGCENLDITSFDIPDLNKVTDMSEMFRDCKKLNGPKNINYWNTENVINMSSLFLNCELFNQLIKDWNTANVTSMTFMFCGAKLFNQQLSNWNTSSVKNMMYMFSGAELFNQSIKDWNTGNVVKMSGMFMGAKSFNQPIENWNTENVKDMRFMFSGTVTFNQPLENWNVENVKDMSFMFVGAYNFNQSIDNWNTSNTVIKFKMFSE